ncbi:MAG: heptosyltransferase, partial [Desulfovibrio sp.]|nr:heptosyltransferase [Desulfovibrio sp.]
GKKINPVAIPGGKGLGITLAGRNARRSLPPEILAKIAALVDSVLKPGEIRLFGAATEKRLARELILSLPATPRNKINDLTGATGWKDLAEQLTGLDLLLAPDTGTAHLAACLGVPVMAFFLSSALCHETGPYGLGHTVWQASGNCVPCIESAACPIETKCLLPFASRDFYRSLTEFLKEGRPPAKLPDGLLLYQPKFDELGIEFIAAAGNDEYAKKRAYARLLVKNWLRLKTPLDNEAALINEFRDYIGELFPEDEWAVPPERYS